MTTCFVFYNQRVIPLIFLKLKLLKICMSKIKSFIC